MIKITKKRFIGLFKFFSLILFIDYPLLPILSSLKDGKSDCGYSPLFCISIMLLFILIIAFFWCIIWFINYAVFFMEDYRDKKIEKNLLWPFYLYVKYIQNSCKNKSVQSNSIKLILAALCFGVICLFFYELISA
jgi:hypothetical protein